jgi:hypothetical protein
VERTFFYLRGRDSVGWGTEDAIVAFAATFPYRIGKPIATRIEDINDRHEVDMIGFGREQITWKNGLIFRFMSNVAPAEIARLMEKSLVFFDEWTIYQTGRLFLQHGRDTLKEFAWTMTAGNVAQVFMMSRKDDVRLNSWAQELRENIKGPSTCVIEFIDGLVLFVSTSQPAPVIANRCARQLEKLENWAIVDGTGYTHSKSDREAVWRRIKLPPVEFVDDDDEIDEDNVDSW